MDEAGPFGRAGVSPWPGLALTKVMNEHEDVVARLRSLGRRPVADDVAGRHLAALAGEAAGPVRPARSYRPKIVAAFAVGLLAGTTGLASAGALPNGAQEVAHRALSSVGVNVPHGDRYQGPECGGPVKNHGQYVRSQPKGSRAQAAASRCGKPLQAGQDGSDDAGGTAGGPAAGCQGPPPWAGKGKPDKAAKAARQKACGDGADDADEGGGPASGGAGSPAVTPQTPAPAPTEPPTTATTSPVTTTSAPTTTTTAGPVVTSPTTATTGTTTTTADSGPHDATTTTTVASGPGGSATTVTSPLPGLVS